MSFCVQGLHLLKKPKNQISFHRHFKCLRVAWSIAAALVIERKSFETDIIMELFLGNGMVCTFVARWVKVTEVPTLNN